MAEQKVKRVAIVQLDRAEQVLASLPAINGITELHKDAEFFYFLSTELSPIQDALGFERVEFIPRHPKDIEIVLEKFSQEFDVLINLSKSAEGLVLASGLCARKRVGLYLDGENAFIEGSDLWCTYLEGVAGRSQHNAFHISDVYARVAGVSQENYEYKLNSFSFTEDSNPTVKDFCGREGAKIAMAVSSVGIEAGIFIVHGLLEAFGNLQIALTGTLSSRQASQQILEANRHYKNRIVDLTGQTTARDLAHLAIASDLTISKPGLLSQLSAGYGTLCITVQPEDSNLLENAPYGHGHLVLERTNACTPELLATAIGESVYFLIGTGRSDPPSPQQWQEFFDHLIASHMGHIRVFLTQRVATPCEGGREMIELKIFPLLFEGYTYDETLRSFYRLLWNLELDNRGDMVEHLDILAATTMPLLRSLLRPLEQLGELASFGIRYSNLIATALSKNKIAEAKESGQSLQEVDDTISVICDRTRELLPLRNFFALQQQRVIDTDPIKSARSMEVCYRELQGNVLILLELINSLFQQESTQLREHTSNG